MRKIIIICSLILSGLAFADQSDNPYVYDEPETGTMAEGDAPAGPGDPNPAPIDQYIPVLVFVGIAMAFVYGRKRDIA